jgi:hypothetical protein
MGVVEVVLLTLEVVEELEDIELLVLVHRLYDIRF